MTTSPNPASVAGPSAKDRAGEPRARLLVVEDDRSTRIILEKQLKLSGYAVDLAENGAQGLEMIRKLQPEIVISDWMMPEMDGQELCSRVKADPRLPSIYFIMLTAKDLREDRVTGLDSGADEYLVKPCDPAELMARIRAGERIITLQRILTAKNRELEAAMKRIHQELEITSGIQRSLLPQVLPSVPGYTFAAHYRPSTECSGDYYDVIALGRGRFGVIMADVSGHGTPAMVAMALTRSLVHQLAPVAASPAEFLMRINRMLYDHLPTSQYVTAFCAVFDAASGEMKYSSAGHNPPLLLRAKARTAEYLEHCEGFPLKLVTPEAEYGNFTLRLEPGDALLLYTDGIPEACNDADELFGPERLSEAALGESPFTPTRLVESINGRLAEFIGGHPLRDDVSMLVVGRD